MNYSPARVRSDRQPKHWLCVVLTIRCMAFQRGVSKVRRSRSLKPGIGCYCWDGVLGRNMTSFLKTEHGLSLIPFRACFYSPSLMNYPAASSRVSQSLFSRRPESRHENWIPAFAGMTNAASCGESNPKRLKGSRVGHARPPPALP